MDKHVVAEIEKVTRRPALSTASALNAAFAVLGAKRLVPKLIDAFNGP
jgi:hypothetical protein